MFYVSSIIDVSPDLGGSGRARRGNLFFIEGSEKRRGGNQAQGEHITYFSVSNSFLWDIKDIGMDLRARQRVSSLVLGLRGIQLEIRSS